MSDEITRNEIEKQLNATLEKTNDLTLKMITTTKQLDVQVAELPICNIGLIAERFDSYELYTKECADKKIFVAYRKYQPTPKKVLIVDNSDNIRLIVTENRDIIESKDYSFGIDENTCRLQWYIDNSAI